MNAPRRGSRAGPVGAAAIRDELLLEFAAFARRSTLPRPWTEAQVHTARRMLKRARAELHVLRPSLDADTFNAANRHLRDAGRCLGAARDASVLRETLTGLLASTLPNALRANAAAAELLGPDPAARRDSATKALRHVAEAAAALQGASVRQRGWQAIGKGMRRVYRRGRRLRPARSARPTAEQLHAWRRRTKRYWHALELLEPTDPKMIGPLIVDARQLADLLGRDHDLAILGDRLTALPERTAQVDDLLRVISARRAGLRRRALELGARVYAARPRELEGTLETSWRSWRNGL